MMARLNGGLVPGPGFRSRSWRAAGAVFGLAVVLIGCGSGIVQSAPADAGGVASATATPTSVPTPVPTPSLDELLAALGDPESAETRAWAAESLAGVQDPAITAALVAALADRDRSVRTAVATSLGSLEDAGATRPLSVALQAELKADPASAFVAAACAALGQLGGATGVAALIAVLATTDEANLDAARAALKEIGAPAVPALQKALLTGAREKKIQVVNVLASLGSGGVKPLITALTNKDAKVRSAAANRLGHLGDTSAEKGLASVLADPGMGLTASVAMARLFKDEPAQLVHYLTATRTLHVYYGLMQVGASETVDAIARALLRLGDLDMAEDLLNCGEATLEQAAYDWANAHGYTVVPGAGSAHASWGSGLAD